MSTALLSEHWPLFGLRVRTPRLELRYPTDDDIAIIAERSARDGVHDPAEMPFTVEWTDVPAPLQQRNSLQHHWRHRAEWTPEHWSCVLAVVVDGRIVGVQGAMADQYALVRTASTGSFLFLPEQRKGIGTEMRAAILHLLFAGLGADTALTAAWADNPASLQVTAKLGYSPNGVGTRLSRGAPRELAHYQLTRAAWQDRRRDDIQIDGLAACLSMFGLPAAPESTAAPAVGS